MNRSLHLLVLSLCACAPEPEARDRVEKGHLDLSWHVPDGCDGADVAEVQVVAGDDVVATAACEDGEVVARVKPGVMLVRVEGVDRDGTPRYAAEAGVALDEGEERSLPTLVLEALPAEVEVAWFFDNARLCATNGVVTVEAAAFEDGTRVGDVEAACDRGGAVIRDLPAGEYLLDVVGRDAAGRAVFTGEADIDVDKGDRIEVEVALGPA